MGFIGFHVLGGRLGFLGCMATRAGTLPAVVDAVQTNLHLVTHTQVEIWFGVAMAAFDAGEPLSHR